MSVERSDLLIEAGLSVDDIKSFSQSEINCWNVAVSHFNDEKKVENQQNHHEHHEHQNLPLITALHHLEEKQKKLQIDMHKKMFDGATIVISLGFLVYQLFTCADELGKMNESLSKYNTSIKSILQRLI